MEPLFQQNETKNKLTPLLPPVNLLQPTFSGMPKDLMTNLVPYNFSSPLDLDDFDDAPLFKNFRPIKQKISSHDDLISQAKEG